MDPRDLINKRMKKSDLMEDDATLISDINKAIEEFQYEGFKKMGPGNIGSAVGSKGREGLAARFKGKNGGFDNSACMTAMKGKVSNPAAFCRSLEGYATGKYGPTTEKEGIEKGTARKVGELALTGLGAVGVASLLRRLKQWKQSRRQREKTAKKGRE